DGALGLLTGLRLPAREHEAVGAALAHGQHLAVAVADDEGGDGDDVGHGRIVPRRPQATARRPAGRRPTPGRPGSPLTGGWSAGRLVRPPAGRDDTRRLPGPGPAPPARVDRR